MPRARRSPSSGSPASTPSSIRPACASTSSATPLPRTPDGSPNRAKIKPALPLMAKQLPVLDTALATDAAFSSPPRSPLPTSTSFRSLYLQSFGRAAMREAPERLTQFIERMLARPSSRPRRRRRPRRRMSERRPLASRETGQPRPTFVRAPFSQARCSSVSPPTRRASAGRRVCP